MGHSAESNRQPESYESDTLTTRPLTPIGSSLLGAPTSAIKSKGTSPNETGQDMTKVTTE